MSMERTYLCIDLRSFYASVECADQGLDPDQAHLVVADPERGLDTICLAVSPALKRLGVPGRCRVREIPTRYHPILARPRMRRYMEISADIYGIYLRYVSPDDIHVYSIDECFLDVTPYLGPYRKTAVEMARMLMDAVYRETHIGSAAGIGPNLFLAKVALDITAKHVPDHIGILDEQGFREQIWHHRPITDIWGIGHGIAARLAKFGVQDLHGITLLPERSLYREFGAPAEYLIDHAWGRESCTIEEIHQFRPESRSLTNGQILPEPYPPDAAFLVLTEMVDQLVLDLVANHLLASTVSLRVGYSATRMPGHSLSRRLMAPSASFRKIMDMYRIFWEEIHPVDQVRSLAIEFKDLQDGDGEALTLLSDPEKDRKERSLQETVAALKDRFGRNIVLRGISLDSRSTQKDRNQQVGGHHE